MSMKNMAMAFPPSVSSAWSKEAKPAVLRVTAWKKPLSSLSATDKLPKVPGLSHSVRQVRAQAVRIRPRLVTSTSLV